jgi:hypothetical protein
MSVSGLTLLGDVIDKQGPDSTTVVSRGNRSVSLLTGCVPDLRFDGLAIHLHRHTRISQSSYRDKDRSTKVMHTSFFDLCDAQQCAGQS